MGIIEVRGLVKQYQKVRAVNGISFSIKKGSCFGLLGPNGAGKTTTIEMMEGITQPTEGEILFGGVSIGPEFKEKTGIQFQATALQDFLTAKEVLELFRSFYRNPVALSELSRLCSLDKFLEQDTHELSGGQRQRVLLAIALVNNPDVVFLDEPTTGLDPKARRDFWDLIRTIKNQGKTVVITTHYMEEAYLLCDEIAIMNAGNIIAQGAPDVLLNQHFNGVTLEIPKGDFNHSTFSTLKKREAESGSTWKMIDTTDLVEIHTSRVEDSIRTLLEFGVSLRNLKIRSQSLEDLFLHLTGKEIT